MTARGTSIASRRLACIAVLALGLAAGPLVAQTSRPTRRTPDRADAKTFPVKPVLEAELGSIDDELAAYMQFRGEVPADAAARLELLIDLRVVARWLLTQAVEEKPESDLQVVLLLRALEMNDTARTLAELFRTMPKPSAQQLDAMGKIHALTFKLPELKQIRQTDEICREIGSLLVTAGGPLPPEVRQIPLMRPAVSSGDATATKTTQPAKTTTDPVARANALLVSAPLKKQVLNVLTLAAGAVAEARTDPKKSPEAATLQGAADRALDLAEGLAKGTAVDASSRPQLEQRLADGLALFADPRTRSAGQARLSSLDDYARTVGRIRRMNLKPELQQKLMPAFAWASDHSDQSGKLLATIETYLALSAKLDARAAAPQQQLPPREAKAVADAIKAATTERDAFLNDASSLGKPGLTVDVATLTARLEAMTQAVASAETYEQVPRSLQILLAYKPRPTGALERRFSALMAALNDARPSAAKDDAARSMAEMVRLAELASELDGSMSVPPEVQQLYTNNKLQAFETRRKELVTDIASELAAGKPADKAKMRRLEEMRELRAALAEAVMFEVVLRKAEPLSRWIDWPIDPAELQAFVSPYRTAVGQLFEAYCTDATPPVSFQPLRERYSPVFRLVIRQLPYGDPCAGLPTSLAGHAGRLMTPIEGQPFADERYAGYAMTLWQRYHASGDAKSAEMVADALARRVK